MSNFCYKVTINIILELLTVLSFCQDIIFVNEDEVSPNRYAVQPATKIPEHLLIRMKDVYNVTDFLNRFVAGNDDIAEIENTRLNISRRRGFDSAAAAAAAIAQFATCKTELHKVELEKPEDGAIFLWPPCIRVRRCGGCCTSKLLICHPVVTSILNITVLQARYNPQTPDRFETQGTRVISLEQHDRCTCSCKERPEDCLPNVQEYRQSECRCVCVNQDQAANCTGPKKVWDSRDCLCKCKRVQQCSTGRYFSSTRCRCEALRISVDVSSEALPERH